LAWRKIWIIQFFWLAGRVWGRVAGWAPPVFQIRFLGPAQNAQVTVINGIILGRFSDDLGPIGFCLGPRPLCSLFAVLPFWGAKTPQFTINAAIILSKAGVKGGRGALRDRCFQHVRLQGLGHMGSKGWGKRPLRHQMATKCWLENRSKQVLFQIRGRRRLPHKAAEASKGAGLGGIWAPSAGA
jgi:hypothetical protein